MEKKVLLHIKNENHMIMKNVALNTLIALLLIISPIVFAQESPTVHAEKTVNGLTIKIDYSSPQVRDRVIWGGLEPYDKVWRTGANNATTLEVTENAKIGKNKLPAGKYALFTIPMKGDTWTVIINKVADQWGAYNYKEGEDLFRFDVKVDRTIDISESLKFDILDDGTVVFAWEYKSFKFKIEK
ncbi:MAG: DUF2911 domain-containing protein [Cyclobacteriaceae bacterium]|nr:DUF2911 domain-containing protein [Cyclobacteriaceae bacterium]